MEISIVLSKRYLNKSTKLLSYLTTEWGNKIAKEFNLELDRRLIQILSQPNIGLASTNFKNTRSILISKHNRLVYRITPKQIIIIDLIDTRQK